MPSPSKPPHRLRNCLRPEATAPTTEVPTPQAGESSAEASTAQSPAPSGAPSLASPETSRLGPFHSPDDQSPTIVMGQLVTITSPAIVRDGPSSSAKIIGRAYAGANARVAATDSGWAQVEDAASGNKGWVESSILEPSTTTAATRRLTWRRRTLGQKTSAPLRLKTEMREAGQSTPPKQNDIAQNITMDAAGSSSGSRFEVCSVGHKHGGHPRSLLGPA